MKTMINKSVLALCLLLGSLFCFAAAARSPVILAPPAVAKGSGDVIPNEYIVVVRRDVSPVQWSRLQSFVRRIAPLMCDDGEGENNNCEVYDFYTIGERFKAFSGRFNGKLLRLLQKQVEVDEIYPNTFVHAFGIQNSPPSWGLDRIDQEDLPLDNTYRYSDKSGEGATIYVLDTGIRIAHEDFGGRASYGIATCRRCKTAEDGNGHGTHASSTAGGSQYGVAKNSQLVAVKVLSDIGMGGIDGILGGLEYVINEAASRNATVVNMSLGAGASDVLDAAVEEVVAAGVHVVVAAGNEDQNACNVSPARAASVITVGATDKTDLLASFSNWGNCVDILAPGVDITGAWIASNNDEKTISGTSMASPHVAGLVAEIAAAYPEWSPSQLKDYLLAMASSNLVDLRGQDDTPNLLLFNNANNSTMYISKH